MWLLLLISCAGEPPQQVWAKHPSGAGANALPREGVSFLETRQGDELLVAASPAGQVALRRAGFQTRVAPPAAEGWFPDPTEIDQEVWALAQAYPDQAEAIVLGRSEEGRPIWALRIGTGTRARWRVLGAHHGDETASIAVSLSFARYLLSSDADAVALRAQDEFWVVPQVNPDGVAAGTRWNARYVDLNRNYSYAWTETELAAGDAPFSERETQSIREWGRWAPAAGGLSLHAGAANIGWVWNWTAERTPDEALLRGVGETYREDCAVSGFWATNGADWYITHGDTTDWTYASQGALDYTLEVSVTKAPSESSLEGLSLAHVPAMVEHFSNQPLGFGRLVDAQRGDPLPGWLHFEDGRPSLRIGPDGRFARALLGPTAVRVESPGWESQEALWTPGEPLQLEAQPTTGVCPSRWWLDADGKLRGPTISGEIWAINEEERLSASTDAKGAPRFDLDHLRPGLYDLEFSEGVCPRALHVPPLSLQTTRLEIAEPAVGDPPSGSGDTGESGALRPQLIVEVSGLETGSRLWAVVPATRALHPVQYESQGRQLRVDLQGLPAGEPLDLILQSGGDQTAFLDVRGAPFTLSRRHPQVRSGRQAPPSSCDHTDGGAWNFGALCLVPFLLISRRRS